jgi:cell division transport system permease protein
MIPLYINEMWDGFRRAKISTFLSILTIAFFLVLIGFFSIINLNLNKMTQGLHSQIPLEAFVSNTLDDRQIALLEKKLLEINGIGNIEYISKESAAREFQKTFGKELFNILQENPLPSSFSIRVQESFYNEQALKKIAKQIEQLRGIDEVVYHAQTLSLIDRYSRIANLILFLLLLFVVSGSLFVVGNTIRLVIASRKDIIETMKLVGATPTFIHTPLLLEGIMQGGCAGLLASAFLSALFYFISKQLPDIGISVWHFAALISGGIVLGICGSAWAIRRFL